MSTVCMIFQMFERVYIFISTKVANQESIAKNDVTSLVNQNWISKYSDQ